MRYLSLTGFQYSSSRGFSIENYVFIAMALCTIVTNGGKKLVSAWYHNIVSIFERDKCQTDPASFSLRFLDSSFGSTWNLLVRTKLLNKKFHSVPPLLIKNTKKQKNKKKKNPKRLILLTIFSMVSVEATLNNKINYHFFTNNKSLMNINENDISAIFRYLHENNSHERDNLSIRKSNHLKSLLPILDKNIWRDQYIKIYSITFPISFNRRSQRKV